jgi:hypothetical protein
MKSRFTRLRWTAIALLLIGLIAGIVGDLIRVAALAVAVVLLFIDYRQGRSQPR